MISTGALNVAWRASRDGCLYGVTYASSRISSDANTQVMNHEKLDAALRQFGKLIDDSFQKT